MSNCLVVNCNNTGASSQKSFFRFPIEEPRNKQWLEILKLKSNPAYHSTICEDHFKCSQFVNTQKTRLKKDALPYRNELEFTSELPTPQIGGNVQETLQYGPSTSVTKQIIIIRQQRLIKSSDSSPPVGQPLLMNSTAITSLPITGVSTTNGDKQRTIIQLPDSATLFLDASAMTKLTEQSQQDCLFCSHPIEQNVNDTQEQSKDVYRDIFECSKELLKDKINYSEWIYSEECLSPLCDQCFKSSEKMYEVKQKLMEFKKTLDELVEKLILEINDRISKVIKDEDVLEEIKMEDDEVLQEDADFICDDYDKESSPFDLENETEVINPFNSDAEDSSDGKEDPLNLDDHCITENVNEESLEMPQVDLNCSKILLESSVPSNSDCQQSRIKASILLPCVVLQKLKLDDNRRNVKQNRKQNFGGFTVELTEGFIPSTEDRDLHQRRVHGGNPYSCNICSRFYKSKKVLQQHKKKCHSGSALRYYICDRDDCSKSFKTRERLRRHIVKEHAEQEIIFECHICKKKLTSRAGLQLHITIHGEKKIQCTTCGKRFSDARFLKIHSANHEIGDFECRICGKKNNTKLKLRSHMRLMHRLEKSHSCDICGYTSKEKQKIRTHIEAVHKGIAKHKCGTCGMPFSLKANLKRHESTHKAPSERKMFRCEICDRCYKSDSEKILHRIKIHTAYTEEMSHCGKCGNKFFNGSELYKHNQIRHWDPSKSSSTVSPSKCRHCKDFFPSRCDMLLHYAGAHPTEKLPYKCEICHVVLSGPLILKRHRISGCGNSVSNADDNNKVDKTKEVLPYKCSLCGKVFKLKYNLRNHESNVHNLVPDTSSQRDDIIPPKKVAISGENKYQCPICGNAYKKLLSYKDHMRSHSGEKPYICETCGKSFSRRESLRCHKKLHSEERLACKICGKTFAQLSYLKLHENSHSEERLTCATCGKTFSHSHSLKSHERSSHPSEERHFVCSFCGKTFGQRSNLKIHEQGVHSVERPFVCSICGKAFTLANNMRMHEKLHGGQQFPCSICGKTFSVKANLATHERRHTGERPFQCNYCGKAFVQSSHLKTHERIHTGEKPFSCSICEKRFSDYSTLHKHKKTHK